MADTANQPDDDDLVLRGGLMLPNDLILNVAAHFAEHHTYALSVFSHPGADLVSLARKACRPNPKMRMSAVRRIRDAGYDVVNCDDEWHCDLPLSGPGTDDDWAAITSAFDEPIPNPNAGAVGCL